MARKGREGQRGNDSKENMARKGREGQRGKDSEERIASKGREGQRSKDGEVRMSRKRRNSLGAIHKGRPQNFAIFYPPPLPPRTQNLAFYR